MTETLATWGAWERAIRDDRSITSCRPALSARCAGCTSRMVTPHGVGDSRASRAPHRYGQPMPTLL